jgi:hypothetical protein
MLKSNRNYRKKLARGAVLAAFLLSASPAMAAFDAAIYYGFGTQNTTTNGTQGADMSTSNIGGWADMTFSLPVPAVNFFLGFGLFGDSMSFSNDNNLDYQLADLGGQAIVGAGLFDLTLMVRAGFGYAFGTNTYTTTVSGKSQSVDDAISGTLVNIGIGLDYKVIAVLHLFFEMGLPQYSLNSEFTNNDFTQNGPTWRFGARLAL